VGKQDKVNLTLQQQDDLTEAYRRVYHSDFKDIKKLEATCVQPYSSFIKEGVTTRTGMMFKVISVVLLLTADTSVHVGAANRRVHRIRTTG
jgi:hypothetical protein